MKTFEKIKFLRSLFCLRQDQIADYLGMQRSNYAAVETEKLKPSKLQIDRLAFLFGVTREYLLDKQFDHVFENTINLLFIRDDSRKEQHKLYLLCKEFLPSFLKDISVTDIFIAKNIVIYHNSYKELFILRIPEYLLKVFNSSHNQFKTIKIDFDITFENTIDIIKNPFSFIPLAGIDFLLSKTALPLNEIKNFSKSYIELINSSEFIERSNIMRDITWGFETGLRRKWEFDCEIRVIADDGITQYDALNELLRLEQLYERTGHRMHISPKPKKVSRTRSISGLSEKGQP